MILWEGKGFNNKKVACIVTGLDKPTANKKTGNLLQTWFIGTDKPPAEQKKNKVHSVCNLCPLIARGCYVMTQWSVSAIYNKYKNGGYKKITDLNIFKGRKVRWGSYGEGILCNYNLFKKINKISSGWTAYTHNHHLKKYQKYKQWMMASVENLQQAKECWKKNWRTFRIVKDIKEKTEFEVICPAQPAYFEIAKKKITCEDCMLCCGNASKSPKSIVIVAHGGAAKLQSVTKYLEEMANGEGATI